MDSADADGDDENVPDKLRENTDIEPVAMFRNHKHVYKELLHRFVATSVVDLTAMDCELAMIALSSRTPIFAVCCSPEHAKAYQERLEQQVIKEQTQEGSTLFNKGFAELIAKMHGKATEKGEQVSKGTKRDRVSGSRRMAQAAGGSKRKNANYVKAAAKKKSRNKKAKLRDDEVEDDEELDDEEDLEDDDDEEELNDDDE